MVEHHGHGVPLGGQVVRGNAGFCAEGAGVEAVAAVEPVGHIVFVAHFDDFAVGEVFGFVRGDAGDAGFEGGDGAMDGKR